MIKVNHWKKILNKVLLEKYTNNFRNENPNKTTTTYKLFPFSKDLIGMLKNGISVDNYIEIEKNKTKIQSDFANKYNFQLLNKANTNWELKEQQVRDLKSQLLIK